MRTITISLLISSLFYFSCNNLSTNGSSSLEKMKYPDTRKESIIDTYFGTEVPDPYRWLENDTATDVAEWVQAQNIVTFSYLDKISFRDKLRSRLEELYNYEKVSSPMKAGEYYFMYKNDGLQNQAVIYRQKGLDGELEVFLDPNSMSESGTVAVNLLSVSKDDRYIAYSVAAAGSDWQEIFVKEVATGELLNDVIKWVKFSGTSWYGDGFFLHAISRASRRERIERCEQPEYHLLPQARYRPV